jgi:hypothetical protein
MAFLLPVLGAARRTSQRLVCASNMRQLGIAFIAYTSDNKGAFPGPGWYGGEVPHDWIYFDGRPVKQSRLYPYLRTDKLFTCPLGGVSKFKEVYPFSYAINGWVSGLPGTTWDDWKRGGPSFPPPGRISMFKNVAGVLMVVEPNSETILDGWWGPPTNHWRGWTGVIWSALSLRHAGRPEFNGIKPPHRGMVHGICIDGHYELFQHQDAFIRRHYDPYWQGEPERYPDGPGNPPG